MLNVLNYKKPEPIAGALNVWPHQVERNPGLIESMIRYRDGRAVKVSARKTQVVEVQPAAAAVFLQKNHLNGSTAGVEYAYGLEHGGQLLMIVTLGRPRYTKHFTLEVLRLAAERDHCVVGGASKLFSFILKQHPMDSILSYSDRLLGEGEVYRAAGFTHLGSTNPGYFWEKDGQVLHRHQTQKRRLIKILGPEIDLTKSERALMTQAGWHLVKDLGHHRWGLRAEAAPPPPEKKFNYVYKITRPEVDDAYYIGVHSTDDLADGYLGSGLYLSASLAKHGRDRHVKEIIEVFATREAALAKEAELVTVELLSDPNCMNIALGGGSPVTIAGATSGRISIWHEGGKELRVTNDEVDVFLARGWKLGRHPINKKHLHGKWFIREDGSQGRTDGELPPGARPGKTGSTGGRKWVVRNGVRQLVSEVMAGDIVGFFPTKTNKGKKVNSTSRRTAGLIGLRSPTGEKRLVDPVKARELVRTGWVLANKQLKSAPPQVLELAAELGMKLPKKRV